jgi:hypothetical protein
MGSMDTGQVAMLREALSSSPWMRQAREFARGLRTTRTPGGLLLVGTPDEEPWHLAAHLGDESRWSDLPQLRPTLIRWAPPPDAPSHLRVGMERVTATGRGETVFVVAEQTAPVPLLERVDDARRSGATILSLDGGDAELQGLAHDALPVPPDDGLVSFDGAQHLVSAAAGEPDDRSRGRGLRGRLARLLDVVSGPVPD